MTIQSYLQSAEADYESHAWDQWDFRWSAEAVAKAAAARGEILPQNVRFLVNRICAAHEAAQARSLETAEAAEAARAEAIKAAAVTYGWSPEEANYVRSCPDVATAVSAVQDYRSEPYRRARAEKLLLAASEAAGLTARTVRYSQSYTSHEDSFGGLSGGDYETHASYQWRPWAALAIDAMIADERNSAEICRQAVAAEQAAAAHRAAVGAEIRAAIAAHWVSVGRWSGQGRSALSWNRGRSYRDLVEFPGLGAPEESDEVLQAWPEIRARIARCEAAIAKAAELRKSRELRAAGLREQEIRQARESESAERRLRQLARVRSEWRRMLDWIPVCKAIRNLHPDAQMLLERIRVAQTRADGLRAIREGNERAARWNRTAPAKARPQSWGSTSAWGALDGLKL